MDGNFNCAQVPAGTRTTGVKYRHGLACSKPVLKSKFANVPRQSCSPSKVEPCRGAVVAAIGPSPEPFLPRPLRAERDPGPEKRKLGIRAWKGTTIQLIRLVLNLRAILHTMHALESLEYRSLSQPVLRRPTIGNSKSPWCLMIPRQGGRHHHSYG